MKFLFTSQDDQIQNNSKIAFKSLIRKKNSFKNFNKRFLNNWKTVKQKWFKF